MRRHRWSSTFLDTFRYLDQLGRLAREGVQVVMHNTLAASDYGLLDEATHLPAELLGRTVMAQLMEPWCSIRRLHAAGPAMCTRTACGAKGPAVWRCLSST